ncbi:hypothetical protein COW36_22375 [bacterium (Candidatus Blackallbacteria) CG17_big_fil_post_rev_8_21_14_2_50_48_46]|uniref:Uncharacterized protein n=1 Tax=bacterium (Candidatus Blackallbacteria) CG17_big_fil_post_rev_8_21_14_2_50_48_46 TaxID=2014261 RepID=A0A2M7FYU3_9BACT|nr:MAG: hypothetical protein COW64_13805 [bacterium (Candidatus Blackallbacteria) CG18_big_fil_WC_8_21_14_2_50_49_26]PIW14359.1 MAG: hypothetical protein COW36_22375 [bacterium (Candidatus Blackallbacteria) CG17_big_fil_post_rev_8_21_14_2_50_48_46]PIW45628.1 MAG: hypothetical protein COW20_19980 [bacterium (Candidatus Blackallbacteria) CG13_big_fil_rev_8_21_14_2_50_49_14]
MDVDQPFSLDFKVWNGTVTGYLWQFAGTTGLPAGLSFTSATGGNVTGSPAPLNGLLSVPDNTVTLHGTTSEIGTFPFTLTVTNGAQTTQRAYNLVVRSLQIFPGSIAPANAGSAYNQAFKAMYGKGPYTWSSTGTLPPGLSVGTSTSDTVSLSGTPDGNINLRTYTFTIKVTDSNNRSAQQTYVLGCGNGALADFRNAQPVVNTVSPVSGANNAAQTLTISGSNFSATAQVFLERIPLTVVSRTGSTQIVATVPAGVAAGAYNILIMNPDSAVGRIEGGLANGYTVTDAGGLVSSVPVIAGVYLRAQPIVPTTTIEELQAQVLTYQGNLLRSLDQNTLEFAPVLIQGANFKPDSLVYLSELILPGFYINEFQILAIIPTKLLFPDLPGGGDQFTGYNKLQIVNPNLEVSDVNQGKLSVTGTITTAEGPGVGRISYVYPQKGFDSENNRVVAKGCGFERPHSFTMGSSAITQKLVELPSVARMAITPGTLFPNTSAYDLKLFRVVSLQPVLSDTGSAVFTMQARERKVTSCTPAQIVPNLTLAINVNGTGIEQGVQIKYIRNGGTANGTEYSAPITGVKTSLVAIPVVPAGLPQGEYKIKMTWPDNFSYTTSGTCLTIQPLANQAAPVINSVSPSSISNNILDPNAVVTWTINGSGFASGASIYIGAKQAISGTGSATQLTLNSDSIFGMPAGDYTITVVNPDGQAAQSPSKLTVTNGGATLAGTPQILGISYPSGPVTYKSMLLPNYPDSGYVYFTASNILPGSYVQVVKDPNSAFNPQDAYLDGVTIIDQNSGSVRGILPHLPAGNYYLRLVNADGQMHTSTPFVTFANSAAPEIETDLTKLTGATDCKQPICPASWPNNLPVTLTINGAAIDATRTTNFGVLPYYSGVQLVSIADPSSVVTLQNVTSYGTKIIAGLPDGVSAGEYRVRVVNPDGQSNDTSNSGAKLVKFTVLDSSTKWSRAQRMPNIVDPGALSAVHGRMGGTAVVDPDANGKIYFFAGNDARQNYNFPTNTLMAYSEGSFWENLSGHSATAPNGNVPANLTKRMYHAAAWKNGATFADDRMFIYGGITWSCDSALSCPTLNGASGLDDLWMYKPSDNTWTQITISGPKKMLFLHKMHWNPADNSLYIYGGAEGASFLNKIFKLTVNEANATATWSEVTFTGGPANLLNAFDMISDPANSRFYILGGGEVITGMPFNSKIWVYHTGSNTWTQLTSNNSANYVPRGYGSHGFDPVNRRIFVYGGGTTASGSAPNGGLSSDLGIGVIDNLSNPTAITWTKDATIPVRTRWAQTSAWLQGRFYVLGGKDSGNNVLLYDPSSPVDPFATGHSYYTDFWQYIP